MRKHLLAIAAVTLLGSSLWAQNPTFKTIQLSDKFYCEGAYYGDFNKDGKLDIVSGAFWYEGPDFAKKHEFRPAKPVDPLQYSDNFLTYTHDFNGDGWIDVFLVGFPARESYWYENPAGKDGPWKQHLAFRSVGGESPVFGDVTGDGKPELLCTFGGQYGYIRPDWSKPTEPWTFIPITPKHPAYVQFMHGQGFADINGDGKTDIFEAAGWWEQPKVLKEGAHWIKHPFKFADAAAQILVTDVDGDGKLDVITAMHCHQYGLSWYRQDRSAGGEITFQHQLIMGKKPEDAPHGVCFTQAHGLDTADFNGDGLVDFVTGKRWWAHGPKGDPESDKPAVLYWFELKRDKDKGPHFIPHLIHSDSGVGTQVTAKDLNGDNIPDIIVGNKKGTFVSLSQRP